jgi:hypothetical protein
MSPWTAWSFTKKLDELLDSEPDIISVGDSSGFFSIQPTIINRYTHGLKYVNLSTGGNHTYDGFKAIAEYMLQRSKHIKFLVLYLVPLSTPEELLFPIGAQGRILHDNLVGLKYRLTPPSAGFSPYAKAEMFGGNALQRGCSVEPQALFRALRHGSPDPGMGAGARQSVRSPSDHATVRLGPAPVVPTPAVHGAILQEGGARRLQQVGQAIRGEARGRIPSSSRRTIKPRDTNAIEQERIIEQFQAENPDVAFLFPLVTAFGTEKFAMWNHISREYTFLSSRRLGMGWAG